MIKLFFNETPERQRHFQEVPFNRLDRQLKECICACFAYQFDHDYRFALINKLLQILCRMFTRKRVGVEAMHYAFTSNVTGKFMKVIINNGGKNT